MSVNPSHERQLTWASRALQVETTDAALLDGLEEFQWDLINELFPNSSPWGEAIPMETQQDQRFSALIDVMTAMTVISEIVEGGTAIAASPLWSLGGVLSGAGRHREAGDAYFRAAKHFWMVVAETASGIRVGDVDDEERWAETALLHSSLNYASAGCLIAAAAVTRHIRASDLLEDATTALNLHLRK